MFAASLRLFSIADAEHVGSIDPAALDLPDRFDDLTEEEAFLSRQDENYWDDVYYWDEQEENALREEFCMAVPGRHCPIVDVHLAQAYAEDDLFSDMHKDVYGFRPRRAYSSREQVELLLTNYWFDLEENCWRHRPHVYRQ